MLLLRGATLFSSNTPNPTSSFNTCSSCEEQLSERFRLLSCGVSIHAPLARSNTARVRPAQNFRVSIHAPLARSNPNCWEILALRDCFNTCSSCEEQLKVPAFSYWNTAFQYMLLLRGATYISFHSPISSAFQYMLLLRGATKNPAFEGGETGFNTCSSCEEQQHVCPSPESDVRFNTCSSCEEQLPSSPYACST